MNVRNPDSQELDLLQTMFYEASVLTGTDGITFTLYNKYEDSDTNEGLYSEPVSFTSGVFYDETPSIRTLKSLNWYVEDEEILPSIVYIPVKLMSLADDFQELEIVSVREGSKLVISIDPSYTKEYMIKTVKAPFRNNVFYTCKLVPWFESVVSNLEDPTFDPSVDDEKFKYLKVRT